MTDIGGTSSTAGGTGEIHSVSGTTPVSTPAKKTGYSQVDTMAAAAAIDPSLILGLFITLPPPNTANANNDNGQLSPVQSFTLDVQKACIKMLTAWNDALAEINKENRIQQNDPNYQAEQKLLKQGANSVENNSDPITGSFTTGLLVTGAAIGSVGVVDTVSTHMVSITPQIDAINTVWSQAAASIPSDMRAELGLIGTLAMGALLTYNQADSVANLAGGGKPVDAKQAATNFADKVLGYVNSDNVNGMIGAFFANKVDGTEQLSPKQKTQFTAMLKSILVATALAALYKSSTGYQSGISMQQFLTSILNGTAKAQNDQEAQLFKAFQSQMSQLSPGQQNSVVQGMSNWMQKNPDLSAILDPGKGFDFVAAQVNGPTETKV